MFDCTTTSHKTCHFQWFCNSSSRIMASLGGYLALGETATQFGSFHSSKRCASCELGVSLIIAF